MNPRRGDALYFGLLALAIGVALSIGDGEDEPAAAAPIDFSLPGIEFELPFELPFARVEFRRPEAPRLQLGSDTEGVIREVRRNLLESSSRQEADVEVSIEVPDGRATKAALAPGERQLAAAFGGSADRPARSAANRSANRSAK